MHRRRYSRLVGHGSNGNVHIDPIGPTALLKNRLRPIGCELVILEQGSEVKDSTHRHREREYGKEAGNQRGRNATVDNGCGGRG